MNETLDIVVGGLRFYRDSILFLFVSYSPSSLNWTKLNQKRLCARSECDLKKYVRHLGYVLHLQLGGPKTTFFDDFAT